MPEGFVGTFTVTITSDQLKRGLRTSKRSPRNAGYLVECKGGVGRDGVLQVQDVLSRLSTSPITDTFPFPQLFVLTNLTLVCSATKIYELVNNSLVLKFTASEPAGVWNVADFHEFLYLSNGKVVVLRDAGSKVYSLSTTLPKASAICNFNGQVIIGSPDMLGLVANLKIPGGVLEVTMTQLGTWA